MTTTAAATTAATVTAEEATATSSPSAAPDSGRPESRAAGARLADLFRAHGRLVLGICRSLLRDPTEAEDAAQQTFLSAYRSLLGGIEPREPSAWLATIARHECWSRVRSRMREPLAYAGMAQELPDPALVAIRNDDVAAFWDALALLPRPQRKAFLLREFGGLSYAQLGDALGVSGAAVESLLFRARTSLRASLSRVASIASVPLALRDRLSDLVPGFEASAPSVGALAKVAALPVAAKLAGVSVSLGLVAVGTASVEHRTRPDRDARPQPAAAVTGAAAQHTTLPRTQAHTQAGRGASSGLATAPKRGATARAAVRERAATPQRRVHEADGDDHAGTPAAHEADHADRSGPGSSGHDSGDDESQDVDVRPVAVPDQEVEEHGGRGDEAVNEPDETVDVSGGGDGGGDSSGSGSGGGSGSGSSGSGSSGSGSSGSGGGDSGKDPTEP